MCTVLLRFLPGAAWPLLLAAVRDEYVDRGWDPPGHHWAGASRRLVGGRDRVAGGTWLAVDPTAPAIAALLNGVPLAPPEAGARPSRGDLPLAVLAGTGLPEPAELSRYDGFYLLCATTRRAEIWSWDGHAVEHTDLDPGDHILTNLGTDNPRDPLVRYFLPLLRALPSPDPSPDGPTESAWGGWARLLAGGGLDPADPRAIIVSREASGRAYGSTSASLVALGEEGVRYDFTGTPGPRAQWREVPPR